MKVWNVLILVNEHKDHNLKITKEVITFLNNNNCQVYIEEEISSKVSEAKILNKDSVVDFALVLGGDGTLLNGLHKYVEKDFPYFGINLGRVGCLLEANTTNYKDK